MDLLTTLPVELILKIYESLPSFFDAIVLSTTCQKLHSLWVNHEATIVEKIVPNQFDCFEDARKLRGEQLRRKKGQNDLSRRNLVELVRNARRIEEAIAEIEHTFIPVLRGVHCMTLDLHLFSTSNLSRR